MKLLITRSEPHATQLSDTLQKLGSQSIRVDTFHVPVMVIEPLALSGVSKSQLLNLDTFDIVIVISANAAELLATHIDHYWPQLPIGIEWVAIGQATANALSKHIPELVASDIHVPSGTDSEALMHLDVFQTLKDKKALLVKGQGGRDLIRNTVVERGAKVTELPLYQRQPAMAHAETLAEAFREPLDIIQVASGDSFLNMVAMLEGRIDRQCLYSSTLCWLVPSVRVAQVLVSNGIPESAIRVCDGASNDAVLTAVEGLIANH
ncbi:uroporphyrinogen-III synthase [Litoribrevibacter euphylliae]|uniref:Uroporphyrinogen-III synthase n=1 Tax=Litoribrevibacter euphylliae TaxID=1834034 RepID=A0ABV7HIS0_9GAMM